MPKQGSSSQRPTRERRRERRVVQHARQAARYARKAERHRKRAAHLGPERRRPEVLDAALRLFLERGYEGTSMDAIAHATGVSKPVVYACFPSKEELFRTLLYREEERILAEIQSAFASTDLDDPEKALTDGFTAFLGAVAARPDVYRLIFLQEGGGNAAITRRIQRGRQAQVDALSELVKRWLERDDRSGQVSTEPATDARLLGHVIASLAEAGARALLSDPSTWSPASLGQTLGRLAARGQAAF
jgi:AcrR family transcriptional regulator